MNNDILPIIQNLSDRATHTFSPQSDDAIIAILIGGFLLITLALGDSTRYIQQLFHNTIAGHSHSQNDEIHTSRSFAIRIILLLLFLVSTGISLMYSLFACGQITSTSQALAYTGIGTVIMAGWLLLKTLLFLIVNTFLFTRVQINQWLRTYTDHILFLGIGLLVIDICAIFLQFTFTLFIVFLAILLFLVEIGLFFKAFSIFFTKNHGLFGNFVYLCTLEWIPLLVAGKIIIRYFSIF